MHRRHILGLIGVSAAVPLDLRCAGRQGRTGNGANARPKHMAST